MTIAANSDDATILAWVQDLIGNIEDIYLRKKLVACDASDTLAGIGIDSFSRINLLYAIVDALGVEAPESVVEQWTTPSDLANFVRSLL